MDISTDRHRSEAVAAGPRPDVLKAVLGMIRRLIESITITEADRKKAGIYIRRNGA
jgi:hypothetical protein